MSIHRRTPTSSESMGGSVGTVVSVGGNMRKVVDRTVCVYCDNDDPTLVEEEPGTQDFRLFTCGVCSRGWREPRKDGGGTT